MRTSQGNPHGAALARFDRLLDEPHPAQPVVDRREILLLGTQRLPVDVPANRPHDAAVDRREGFEVALGVAGRDARATRGGVREIPPATGPHLARPALAADAPLLLVLPPPPPRPP